MDSTRTTALAIILLFVTASGAAADEGDETDRTDEVMVAVKALHDFLANETRMLEENVTGNGTPEQKLDYLLAYVWHKISEIPDYDDMVCYTFELSPIDELVDFDPPLNPSGNRQGYVKVAGFGYDEELDAVGGGYHTFTIDTNGQILCQIVLSTILNPPDVGATIEWRGP